MISINGIEVNGAACDSRKVEPGNLFICKGANFKPEFLRSAIAKGAVAAVMDAETRKKILFNSPLTASSEGEIEDFEESYAESFVGEDFPIIVVDDIRAGQAKYSKIAWGSPDEKLTLIGITGTKGKTTVATFVRSAIEACGHKCGFIGTHHVFDGATHAEPPNTTPEPPDLYRYLAHMVKNGCKYCVMEVSSQGLKYDRVLGLDLDVAAITNIGVDHIAPVEHPTVEDYVKSKFRISEITKKLFVNEDLILKEDARPFVEAGVRQLGDYELYGAPGEQLNLRMQGVFNESNAECALKICDYLGLDHKTCKAAIEDTQVAGRMEIFTSKDGRLVGIVDYAHTKESYEKFFTSQDFDGYVIAYFGASGGKALDRHFDLPQTAAKFCDYIIVTSDDPGTEKPEDVVASVESNLPEGFPHECIVFRDDACKRAFEIARDKLILGEQKVIVCALGKGDEDVCVCAAGDIPFIADNIHVPQMINDYDDERQRSLSSS